MDRDIEKMFIEFKGDINFINRKKEQMKKIAEEYNIVFDPETGEYSEKPLYIPVMEMFIKTESYCEQSGDYACFSKFSEIKDKSTLKYIKEVSKTEDKEKWSNLFNENILKDIDGFKDFLSVLELSGEDYIEEDMIKNIYTTKYMEEDEMKDLREGIESCIGKCYFSYTCDGQELIEGYVSFFYLKSSIYNKIKEPKIFSHKEYIQENDMYEYKPMKF